MFAFVRKRLSGISDLLLVPGFPQMGLIFTALVVQGADKHVYFVL